MANAANVGKTAVYLNVSYKIVGCSEERGEYALTDHDAVLIGLDGSTDDYFWAHDYEVLIPENDVKVVHNLGPAKFQVGERVFHPDMGLVVIISVEEADVYVNTTGETVRRYRVQVGESEVEVGEHSLIPNPLANMSANQRMAVIEEYFRDVFAMAEADPNITTLTLIISATANPHAANGFALSCSASMNYRETVHTDELGRSFQIANLRRQEDAMMKPRMLPKRNSSTTTSVSNNTNDVPF